MKIDKLFYNGTIFTGEADEFTEAVGISGTDIAETGSAERLFKLADGDTELIDLKGKMLMAGFIDSHAHPLSSGVETLYKVDLNDCRSPEEYTAKIRGFIKKHPELDFIMGVGWENPCFDSRGPAKELLDEIAEDMPIVLDSSDHHSIWANSKAIELAKVTAETPDPEGGVIERKETGEPSGTFREAAQDFIRPICPEFTADQYKKGLAAYQKQMAGYGITMAHDAMLPGNAPPHQALLEMDRDGELLFKMNASFETSASGDHDAKEYAAYAKKSRGKMFTADRVKVFIDGVVESRTACLKEEYADRPGYFGECIWDTEEMERFLIDLDKEGLELHFHVIGDRAAEIMLQALEKVRKANGSSPRRPIAAHVQVLDKNDIQGLRRENVHISANPFWFVKAPGYFENEERYLGKERAAEEFFMKSLIDAGLVVGAASDYSATPVPRPLVGIQTAVTRDLPEFGGEEDKILGKEERISVREALLAFTINNARLAKMEERTGSIRKGKLADLVVLERNLFEMDPYEIGETKVVMTLSEGRVIYSAD